MPKVSIILPTHNGSAWISRAVNSVLAQSFSDWELIVVDDGSDDDVGGIVKRFVEKDTRVKYLRNERNIGISESLNRGIKIAKGEYIARIDDDDEWVYADKLTEQMNFLKENPDCILLGTNIVAVDETGKEIGRYSFPKSDAEIRNKLLRVNCFAHSSVVFKRDAVVRAGGYSTSVGLAEDYDLWAKLGAFGKFANIDCYCVRYTIRKTSGSFAARKKFALFGIQLAKKYKNDYPNYRLAIILRYLGLLKYWFLNFLPFSLRLMLTRLKYWIKSKSK